MEKIKIEKALHPGETIKEYLESFNLTVEKLAAKTGISIDKLNRILDQSDPITDDIANALAVTFERPAQFWINLQNNYCESIANAISTTLSPKGIPTTATKKYLLVTTKYVMPFGPSENPEYKFALGCLREEMLAKGHEPVDYIIQIMGYNEFRNGVSCEKCHTMISLSCVTNRRHPDARINEKDGKCAGPHKFVTVCEKCKSSDHLDAEPEDVADIPYTRTLWYCRTCGPTNAIPILKPA